MKLRDLLILALLTVFAASCTSGIKEKTTFESVKDSASYSLGYNIGMQMKGQMVLPDEAALYAGLKDALIDGDTLIALTEMNTVIRKFYDSERKKAEEIAIKDAEANKKKGEEFLAENGKKEGITVLENGMQYKVLESGEGKSPEATSKVKVHYTGKLVNGTVFDSSVKRGEPATFVLNQVIKGWGEILQLMKEGDKWEVFIPSDLAYGDRGTPGGPIPPGSTLIFEISFISIEE